MIIKYNKSALEILCLKIPKNEKQFIDKMNIAQLLLTDVKDNINVILNEKE